MTYDFTLEAQVIRKWIAAEKQERFLASIGRAGSRIKVLDHLARNGTLRLVLFEPCPTVAQLAARARPFADCYLLSTNRALDGRRLPIAQALNVGVSGWADHNTLLVFGDAAMLYVETEGKNQRWISR